MSWLVGSAWVSYEVSLYLYCDRVCRLLLDSSMAHDAFSELWTRSAEFCPISPVGH
jgi:hypothetical protein